jgi:prepilin-type N-terminal cleavage/methylation domain-containing protein
MLNKLKKMRDAREEGFTLIELLVVIVIIGILSAISLPIFLNQQKQAIRAGMKSDVRNLVTSVNTYLVKNPVANNLAYRFDASGPSGALSTVAGFPNVTPSDASTILGIRKTSLSSSGAGSWDGFYAFAASYNASDNSSYYYYEYNSTTGKYSEQNA